MLARSLPSLRIFLINAVSCFNSFIFFPIGTIIVNLLGCFLIGLISGILDTKFISIDDNFKNYITIGFLGGFTTFSSFTQDFFNLINNSSYLLAFSYIFVSVFFGLLMFYLGDKFIHIISFCFYLR